MFWNQPIKKGGDVVGDHLLFLETPSQMPIASLFFAFHRFKKGNRVACSLNDSSSEVLLNMAGSMMLL